MKSFLLPRVGRVNSTIIGCVFIAGGLVIFGVARLVPDDSLFIAMSFLGRLLEGAGLMITSLCFEIMVSAYFKEPSSLFVGIALGAAISDAAGLLFGGLLLGLVGYSGVFFLEAAITALTSLLLFWFRKYEEVRPLPPPEEETVSFWKVLRQGVSSHPHPSRAPSSLR